MGACADRPVLKMFQKYQEQMLQQSAASGGCSNPTTKKVQGIFDYCAQAFGTLHNRKECILKFLTPAPGAIIPPQACNAQALITPRSRCVEESHRVDAACDGQ